MDKGWEGICRGSFIGLFGCIHTWILTALFFFSG